MDFLVHGPLFWAVICAVLCCIAIIIFWELFSPLHAFPGPPAARYTNIWRALVAASGHVDQTNIEWHRTYGSAVRVAPNTISINDPELIRTIYATKNPWPKSDMYRPNDVLINGVRLSNLFNTQDNDWHDTYMNPIRSLWTMTKVLDMESLIDETLNRFTTKLGAKFADVGNKCMMDEWLGYFAWDVMANISFGKHYGFIDEEKDVKNLIVDSTKGLYYFAPISQIPWLDHLLDKNPIKRIGPKPTLTGVNYAIDVVTTYNRVLGTRGDRAENYLDKYVKLKEAHPKIMDDNQVVNYLMLNILAGGDTTSSTMRAVVYYLSKNTSAYRKLISELDAANLSLPAQWKDIRKLTYLDAVIQEALRINPGIAMIFERVAPQSGFTLPDGRFIPGGTAVGINPAVTNRNVDVFGQDADQFNPDRWLKKDEESDEGFRDRCRKMKDVASFVFGGGNRVCMGRNLAILEIYKLFATLYSLFDIELVNNNHAWKYHNAWFVYQYNIPMTVSRRVKA
ncbi:Cytochrome P450 monooxygenase [Lachnellula occidentalis]|uniref:Cytochrome P450 monooxygenase n=1 Tax=Lachnellula occidentalis TaxID=215460 RepID=A0A8H8UJ31_9HELO|nr:Cytochrome P450 monooxygenase [Lachnellula occidentalis]